MLLYNEGQEKSALILIYSGMDIVSSLQVKGLGNTGRQCFIKWANKYVTPKLDYSVSGEDLYNARCAILHTLWIESDMSNRGANLIVYRSGRKKMDLELNEMHSKILKKIANRDIIILWIDDLISAFNEATNECLDDIYNDTQLKKNFLARANKMIIDFQL